MRRTQEEADILQSHQQNTFNSGAILVRPTASPQGPMDEGSTKPSKPTLQWNRCINTKCFLLDSPETKWSTSCSFSPLTVKMGAEETRCQEEYEDAAGKQRIKRLCAVRAGAPGGWG